MQTDRIKIEDFDRGVEAALQEVDKFSQYMAYDRKSVLRVKLLVEETFGMTNAITEKFRAEFWLEGEKDGRCLIHLMLHTNMDIMKKRELIDASKNKKNAAYPGLAGRIRELIEDSIYLKEHPEQQEQIAGNAKQYAWIGMADPSMAPGAPMPMGQYIWSLEDYRQSVEEAMESEENPEAEGAWDELEKSVLTHLADDIRVAVKGNDAEIVVEKKF